MENKFIDNEFISFLKNYNLYNKEIVDSFFGDSFRYNYENDRDIIFSECIYIINNEDILVKIRACIPYINDYKTMLINIHEYVHYYMLYKKIGKKVIIGRNCELLPVAYEKLFIMEKNIQELYDYDDFLTKNILCNNDPNYLYALENRDRIVNYLKKRKSNK